MAKSGSHVRQTLALFFAACLALPTPANAADLQPQTAQAYDRYIELTAAQVNSELAQKESYLWVERLPPAQRASAAEQLRNGQLVIERLDTLDSGKPIPVPGGIIHHWIGTAFVPRVTLAQTLAFMQDYDHKVDYFQPDIVRSKIRRHNGDDYFVLLRFYKKKIITTVIDTDQEVHYHLVDGTHAYSRSRTTRVQEVENAGKSDEKLEPEGHDRGILWRMNTFLAIRRKRRRNLCRVPGDFSDPRYSHRVGLDGRTLCDQRAAGIADVHSHHRARRFAAAGGSAARQVGPRFAQKTRARNHISSRWSFPGKYPRRNWCRAPPDCWRRNKTHRMAVGADRRDQARSVCGRSSGSGGNTR